MKHLIDTEIRVATCNRCRAYVFAATVGGSAVAVDMTPLDVEGVRSSLLAGRRLYDQLDQAGRPWKLHARTAASSWPPYTGKVLADHACGAMGRDATEVTTVDPRLSGAASAVRQTAASDGVSHRSDLWRCMVCHALIEKDEPFYGIEYGAFRWARHDRDCAPRHPALLHGAVRG